MEQLQSGRRYVYYDSGTTNSRAYLICDGTVCDCLTKKVGTVDNVLTGNKDTLVLALYDMYKKLLTRNHLLDEQIHGVYMSGMATSKNGICEVDYLRLPLTVSDYAKAVTYCDNDVFQRNIGYLTGVVSRPSVQGTIFNAAEFNNVRGEEIELFGIMDQFAGLFDNQKTAVIMPGSHTHVLFTSDRSMARILSCMGGELFAAVSKHTILNASVSENPDAPSPSMIQAMIQGYEAVKKYGFNRALYMVRTLDLFTEAEQGERDFFLEGVVNEGILAGIQSSEEFGSLDRICVAGKKVYYDIFHHLIDHEGWNIPCVLIEPQQQGFALAGFLKLIQDKP